VAGGRFGGPRGDGGGWGVESGGGGWADGPPVVPAGWVEDTIRGAADGAKAFRAGEGWTGFPARAHYRNCWWVHDPGSPFLYGSGIYGQNVFVHGPTETVAVKFSTLPSPLD